MKSYSDAVADTNKVQEVESRLTTVIQQTELQMAATIGAVAEQLKKKDGTTNVVLGLFIVAQLAFDAIVLAKNLL
jgi:hypothetical protein